MRIGSSQRFIKLKQHVFYSEHILNSRIFVFCFRLQKQRGYLSRNFIYTNIYINKMDFTIQPEKLASIITANQQRSFDEEITELENFIPIQQWLQKGLKTSYQSGISASQNEIQSRKQFYGSNQKPVKQPPGFCELVWEVLKDVLLRILIVAALLTIGLQTGVAKEEERSTAWIDGFAILIAVIIVVLVTAINDYRKQRQFLKLNSERQKQKVVTVIRSGENIEIHQDFILVGDIVQIKAGMQIPADGILIEANQIKADESPMTGETKPIKKNTLEMCIKKRDSAKQIGKTDETPYAIPSPIMLSGTNVLSGQGKMVVIVVGDLSCLGKIRMILSAEQNQSTPLQNKLEKIAEDIGKFGLASAILILIILIIRFGVEKGTQQNWETQRDLVQLLKYFVLALTVVVVAIPEGLPLAVTLSLAYSVKRMLDDQNLVRRLEACETMGGANNICSDKTGTLTTNKMSLTHIWNETLISLPVYDEHIEANKIFESQQFADLLLLSMAINQSSRLGSENLPEKGSATQIAMLKLLVKFGYKYQEIAHSIGVQTKIPFNSQRKRMSTILRLDGRRIMFIKGASEMVLDSCNQWMSCIDGKTKTIKDNQLQNIKSNITYMAQKSLRTICIAYKQIGKNQLLSEEDKEGVFQIQKNDFILLAIVGIKDIPRVQVPEALRNCKRAGITVRMVTGDNIITAKAIAEEIGIISPGDKETLVMEGKQFYQKIGGVVCKECRTQKCDCPVNSNEAQRMGVQNIRIDTIRYSEQFDVIQKNLLVLARSRPEDKYALVTGLKQKGNVVAVTGDGTNDAPALKKANVGFAMGINGTQVAKDSSDIILLDDNFDSIVKAVLWGRNIYDSVRKFIQFQLTVNVVAVGITIIGAAFFKQEVITRIQMLWLNLIMDTLGSLALATEPPNELLLDRKPHNKDDYIVSTQMTKHIISQACFQLAVLSVLLFAGDLFIPEYKDSFDQMENFKTDYKYTNQMMIRSGRAITISGEPDYDIVYDEIKNYSRHMTFIFNTFVMMQIFNFLNCRKIHDEKNIFANICNNFLFIGIVLAIFILQIILVTFAGYGFGVYSYYGLHPYQWLISIGIAIICLPYRLLITCIPECKSAHGSNKEVDFAHSTSKIMDLKRPHETVERDISYVHIVE